jgi:hypothetical protein
MSGNWPEADEYMPPSVPSFKADRNQLIAVLTMLAAIFTFAAGEIAIGIVLFVIAAVFSIGGLFWNAHAQDKADAAERKNSRQETGSDISKD